MKIEVVVPEEYMGDVIADLNSGVGTDPEHGVPARDPDNPGRCAPGAAVRLRDRSAVGDPGSRQLHDAFFSLRRSPEIDQRRGGRSRSVGTTRR